MKPKDKIIEFASSISVDAIGFCKAEVFDTIKTIYEDRKKNKFTCSLETVDIERKTDPSLTLHNAKTFVVILESYQLNTTIGEATSISGSFSVASVFEDYHKIILRKLELIKEFLEKHFSCECLLFCDTSPFSDRLIAYKAGLGNIGKNSFLINKDYGTATYIGYILTDLGIENYDTPSSEDICINCSICMDACPSNAIIEGHQINANRCISYLTQATEIPNELKGCLGRNLYGCDICQVVCPYNNDNKVNTEHRPVIEKEFSIEKLLGLSNKEYSGTIGKSSAGWRGKKMIQRNGIITLGNISTVESVNVLKKHANDARNDIRREIVYSLWKINTNAAIEVLREMLQKETDTQIKELILSYIG